MKNFAYRENIHHVRQVCILVGKNVKLLDKDLTIHYVLDVCLLGEYMF